MSVGIVTQAGMFDRRAGGGAGGWLDQLTGLVEWWEGLETVGKVASGALLTNNQTPVATGSPIGTGFWRGSGSNSIIRYNSFSEAGDFSILTCLKFRGYAYGYFLFPDADPTPSIGFRYVPFGGDDNTELRIGGATVRNVFDLDGFGGWVALAVSWNSTTSIGKVLIYCSAGSLEYTTSGSLSESPITVPFARRENVDNCISAIYSRQLNMTDLENFYNSGAFTAYPV